MPAMPDRQPPAQRRSARRPGGSAAPSAPPRDRAYVEVPTFAQWAAAHPEFLARSPPTAPLHALGGPADASARRDSPTGVQPTSGAGGTGGTFPEASTSRAGRRTPPRASEPKASARESLRAGDRGEPSKRRRPRKAAPRRRRFSSEGGADTEDEDAAAAIELDEPDRFKALSRLRAKTKRTTFQGKLRLLQKRRKALTFGDPSESSSEDASDENSSEGEGGGGGDSDDASSTDSAAFIDDSMPARHAMLPHEFSLKRDTPEHKFKVVFHYMVVLVVRGARDFLPLQGEDNAYFGRQLRDVRNMMRGLRDSVASALWRPDFRDALETYPLWKQLKLDKPEEFCDACNCHKQKCMHNAWLRGDPYDSETHQDIDEDDGDGKDKGQDKAKNKAKTKAKNKGKDDSSSDSDARELGDMGNICLRCAQDFHELNHWEHLLFLWVRRRYHCLVRARARTGKRVRQLSFDSLADDPTDSEGERADKRHARKESRRVVDFIATRTRPLPALDNAEDVAQYMDACGWRNESMRWLGRIQARARNLAQALRRRGPWGVHSLLLRFSPSRQHAAPLRRTCTVFPGLTTRPPTIPTLYRLRSLCASPPLATKKFGVEYMSTATRWRYIKPHQQRRQTPSAADTLEHKRGETRHCMHGEDAEPLEKPQQAPSLNPHKLHNPQSAQTHKHCIDAAQIHTHASLLTPRLLPLAVAAYRHAANPPAAHCYRARRECAVRSVPYDDQPAVAKSYGT
ncbi:hypothetical protein CspHIS471_0308500 [Cutaneotrichosporon sp. HIS471]|nr:hypothetical protein CspHIS471_0308500 [Cutaneotrichosporon sp. HIS471]